MRAMSVCSPQDFKELQRELASKSCELSAAQLNLHSWKQKAVVERLRLVSVQEDLTHQKVQIEALTAECNRRQEEYNVAQANFQAANEQKIQLGTELSKGAAASAKLQVSNAGSASDFSNMQRQLHIVSFGNANGLRLPLH